jgi:MFS family permease
VKKQVGMLVSTLAGWSRQTMRWLLQLDRPVSVRSEAEVVAEMQRHYRWNFTVNLVEGALFWFGLSFISATTMLPLFISKLTTNPFWIALLAMVGQASWYLPQLFVAGMTERLDRKKPLVVNLGVVIERAPVWLLPVAALISVAQPQGALLLFFVSYAWYGLGAGAIAPAWSDMIARCFPVERRGRFFGLTAFVGTGLGAVGAIFSSWLLQVFPFPTNFALCFLIAATTITLSWFFIALTREPEPAAPVAKTGPGGRQWLKIARVVRSDHNFRRFLIARLLANFGSMGAGFLTVAAIQRWQVADSTVGLFTIALLLGQTAGNLLAGLLADRYGHKLALEWGLALSVAAFVWAWWAPAMLWFYPVFVLLGAASGISIVSGVLVALEFSAPQDRPTHVGIANTTHGVGSLLSPLLGGLLATTGYAWLFALSAAVGLAALWVMRYAVREPRQITIPLAVDPA